MAAGLTSFAGWTCDRPAVAGVGATGTGCCVESLGSAALGGVGVAATGTAGTDAGVLWLTQMTGRAGFNMAALGVVAVSNDVPVCMAAMPASIRRADVTVMNNLLRIGLPCLVLSVCS